MAATSNWRQKIVVSDVLLQGDTFDRYDDVSVQLGPITPMQENNCLDLGCFVRVDEYGFFLVWEPKGKEAGVLDLTQVEGMAYLTNE